MKKVTALILILTMVMALGACGSKAEEPKGDPLPQSPVKTEEPEKEEEVSQIPAPTSPEKKDTEPEKKDPEPVPVKYGVTFEIERLTELAAEKAIVKGVNENNGDVLWTYETDIVYVSELEMIQDIGLCTNGYMFLAGGSVYCLDPVTGEVLWINEGFGGASASWCFDDSGNIYLCGYYGPELCIIAPDGQTLYDYYTLSEDNGMSDCFWPCSMALDENGLVEIGYDSNGMVLFIDPESGWMVDYDINSVALDPALLVGSWITDYGDSGAWLDIAEDMSFTLYLMDDTGFYKNTYEGYVDISEWEEGSGKKDWIRFMLGATDDPVFEGWSSLGDYRSLEMFGQGDDLYFSLVQVNNGDSFWSIYFDDFAPFFMKTESAG